MDAIMPLLAVCALAAGELREWERFPPPHVCEANYYLASNYARWINDESHRLGENGWGLWAQYEAAQNRREIWRHMWNLTTNDDRDNKLKALEWVRYHMADDAAFFREQWPPPLPAEQFDQVGGWYLRWLDVHLKLLENEKPASPMR